MYRLKVPTDTPVHVGSNWSVVNADCMTAGTQEQSADLFFTDPPYNYGLKYGPGVCDLKTEAGYLVYWFERLQAGIGRVRPGGAVWIMIPDEWVARFDVFCTMASGLALERRNWIIWHETFGENQNHKFSRCKRHLLYYVKPISSAPESLHRPYFNGDLVRVPSDRQLKYKDKRANPAGKVPGDVWKFSRVCGTFNERAKMPAGSIGKAPTQVPESLLYRIVMSCVPVGGYVLEFCVGTGSMGRTVLRAGQGRTYEGWEIEPDTARFAAARISEAETLVGQAPPDASAEECGAAGESV